MIQISSNTSLFKDIPTQNFIERDSSEYTETKAKLISGWQLELINQIEPAPQEAPETQAKAPTGQRNTQPKKEIFRNSTGSKVFSLLASMKPSMNARPTNIDPPTKSADAEKPKRKLGFSGQ